MTQIKGMQWICLWTPDFFHLEGMFVNADCQWEQVYNDMWICILDPGFDLERLWQGRAVTGDAVAPSQGAGGRSCQDQEEGRRKSWLCLLHQH